ncbi:MAG TPA: type 4a pilus biogenesis protein PilO [Bryobacteraceae bacterium]|nr:type 4a pilus biogenesis protein PilO [Bryobacteraceae bacterium]
MAKDPRVTVRVVLGLLLIANLVAAAAVFKPWGGSPEDLQRQLAQLSSDAAKRETSLAHLRKLVTTVEKTRSDANKFLEQYFLARRSAYSTILGELAELAEKSGVKMKEHSFVTEPIEGSDTLGMMVITGNYEGAYADIVKFVNQIDRSPRFLTIDTLQATPQQGQGVLNVNMKLNVFVREEPLAR